MSTTRDNACPPPLDGTPAGGARRWRAGSLSYTAPALAALFAWLLLGDFGWWMKERAVPSTLQVMLRQFEASNFTAGLLLGSLPALVRILVVPAVAWRSDRHRSRWGRRIPFLVPLTLLAGVALLGLALAPAAGAWIDGLLGTNAGAIVLCGVFWCVFEMASLPGAVVLNGLINDVVPRALLGRFCGALRAVSLLAGVIFNYWLIGYAEEHAPLLLIGIAAVYCAGFLAMCARVKEGDYPPPPPLDPSRSGLTAAVRTYCRECFSESYYVWAFVAVNLSWLAFVPVTLFGVFFAKRVGMPMETYGKCIALQYLSSFVLSFPLGWLADRFHPLRVGLVAIGGYAVVTLAGGWLAVDAASFGVALVAQGIACSSWMTATASIGQRLFPRERFAQFASAQDVALGLANVLLAGGVGWLLDATEHEYRYTFLIGGALGALAFGATWILQRKFVRLGCPEGGLPAR